MSNLGLIACALLLEAAAGYPDALVRAIGHPVMWVGALIDRLDRAWNGEGDLPRTRRRRGVAAVLVLLSASVGSAMAVQALLNAILPPAAALLV
ncbi:MAG: cobalamin biosynthesis protein, partial [Gemmatimonadaceae bacterium]|nr:cobalamin biosynthesis protein [Acetobacteraceae bacterium]